MSLEIVHQQNDIVFAIGVGRDYLDPLAVPGWIWC
jgi:hypothetical protein